MFVLLVVSFDFQFAYVFSHTRKFMFIFVGTLLVCLIFSNLEFSAHTKISDISVDH